MTAAQWMDKNEIPQSYKDKYNVTAMGLFGANLDEISALSLFEEVAFDFEGFDPSELEDEEGLPIRNGDESAFSFRTGIAEVSKSIAKHLGPAVRTSSTVTSIERNAEGGYTVHYLSGGNEIIVEADIVVIAVPAPIAAKIASKVIPEEQSKVVNNIKYAPYVTCALFFSEPIFTKSFDLAMPPDFSSLIFMIPLGCKGIRTPRHPKISISTPLTSRPKALKIIPSSS